MLQDGARELPDRASRLAGQVRLEGLPVAPERQADALRPARVGIIAIGVEDGVLHHGLGPGAGMAAFGEDDGQADAVLQLGEGGAPLVVVGIVGLQPDAEMERGLDHGMGRRPDGPDEWPWVREASRPFEVGDAQSALRSPVAACRLPVPRQLGLEPQEAAQALCGLDGEIGLQEGLSEVERRCR